MIGALAGAAGQASAHPLDVVRRRMQMEGMRRKFVKEESDSGSAAKPVKPPVKNLVSGLWNIGREVRTSLARPQRASICARPHQTSLATQGWPAERVSSERCIWRALAVLTRPAPIRCAAWCAAQEGWHVLFKGLGPACFEKVPSTAIGYYIYEAMKTVMAVSSV